MEFLQELSVVAFLLAAALERYQAQWDLLVESWFDRRRFHLVNLELDEIQKLKVALPQFAADIIEVVMRHAQLLRSLLRSSDPALISQAQVAALRNKHRIAIESLRGKCLKLLARDS